MYTTSLANNTKRKEKKKKTVEIFLFQLMKKKFTTGIFPK